jgi:hypothetical protein
MPTALLTHVHRQSGIDLKENEKIGTGESTGAGYLFDCSGK